MLCFRKFPVAKKFMEKRGEKYQDFPSKNFCLTVPRNFVREPFRVSLFCGIENFCASEGYVTIICRFFLLTVPKIFVGEPFSAVFQKVSASEKVYGEEGGEVSRISFEKFLSHSAEKFRKGTF